LNVDLPLRKATALQLSTEASLSRQPVMRFIRRRSRELLTSHVNNVHMVREQLIQLLELLVRIFRTDAQAHDPSQDHSSLE
jgi:hypothetical protein